MKTIRIFISSPGDVAYERSLAAEILNRVAKEFDGRLVVEPYFWEHDIFELTRSFQQQIPTPGADPEANYDLMVCFLWSRLSDEGGTVAETSDGNPGENLGTERRGYVVGCAQPRHSFGDDWQLRGIFVSLSSPPRKLRTRIGSAASR